MSQITIIEPTTVKAKFPQDFIRKTNPKTTEKIYEPKKNTYKYIPTTRDVIVTKIDEETKLFQIDTDKAIQVKLFLVKCANYNSSFHVLELKSILQLFANQRNCTRIAKHYQSPSERVRVKKTNLIALTQQGVFQLIYQIQEMKNKCTIFGKKAIHYQSNLVLEFLHQVVVEMIPFYSKEYIERDPIDILYQAAML